MSTEKKPRKSGDDGDTSERRVKLRWYLKRVLMLLQLPERMAFETSAELHKSRDECCGRAYHLAFWTVEEFDEFSLPAVPSPHAEQPDLSRAQLLAWALGIFRGFDGEGAAREAVDKHATKSPRLTAESKAIALLLQHSEWSDTEIAKAAGIHRTTLYKSDQYKAARALLRETGKRELPRGSKDMQTGELEAWEE